MALYPLSHPPMSPAHYPRSVGTVATHPSLRQRVVDSARHNIDMANSPQLAIEHTTLQPFLDAPSPLAVGHISAKKSHDAVVSGKAGFSPDRYRTDEQFQDDQDEPCPPPIPPGYIATGYIEPYLLEENFQECLYGVVFRGWGLHTGDKVAVKLLVKEKIKEKEADRELPETPLAEVFFVPYLHGHPYIFSIREVFEVDLYHFVVSDLATSEDLLELLKLHPFGMPEDYVRYFVRQAAEALVFGHSRRVAMQDFSLENCLLLVNAHGAYNIRVCDPGQAVCFRVNADGEEIPVSYTGCVGKKFRPPEIFNKAPYLASRVDSWCLGWSTFYLLFAVEIIESAWEGDRDLRWHLFKDRRYTELFQLLGIHHRLSPAARDFILRLMDPAPDLRMSVADALLHPFLAAPGIPAALGPENLKGPNQSSPEHGRLPTDTPGAWLLCNTSPFRIPVDYLPPSIREARKREAIAREKMAKCPIIPDIYFNAYAALYCARDKPSGSVLPFEFLHAKAQRAARSEMSTHRPIAAPSRQILASPHHVAGKLPQPSQTKQSNHRAVPLYDVPGHCHGVLDSEAKAPVSKLRENYPDACDSGSVGTPVASTSAPTAASNFVSSSGSHPTPEGSLSDGSSQVERVEPKPPAVQEPASAEITKFRKKGVSDDAQSRTDTPPQVDTVPRTSTPPEVDALPGAGMPSQRKTPQRNDTPPLNGVKTTPNNSTSGLEACEVVARPETPLHKLGPAPMTPSPARDVRYSTKAQQATNGLHPVRPRSMDLFQTISPNGVKDFDPSINSSFGLMRHLIPQKNKPLGWRPDWALSTHAENGLIPDVSTCPEVAPPFDRRNGGPSHTRVFPRRFLPPVSEFAETPEGFSDVSRPPPLPFASSRHTLQPRTEYNHPVFGFPAIAAIGPEAHVPGLQNFFRRDSVGEIFPQSVPGRHSLPVEGVSCSPQIWKKGKLKRGDGDGLGLGHAGLGHGGLHATVGFMVQASENGPRRSRATKIGETPVRKRPDVSTVPAILHGAAAGFSAVPAWFGSPPVRLQANDTTSAAPRGLGPRPPEVAASREANRGSAKHPETEQRPSRPRDGEAARRHVANRAIASQAGRPGTGLVPTRKSRGGASPSPFKNLRDTGSAGDQPSCPPKWVAAAENWADAKVHVAWLPPDHVVKNEGEGHLQSTKKPRPKGTKKTVARDRNGRSKAEASNTKAVRKSRSSRRKPREGIPANSVNEQVLVTTRSIALDNDAAAPTQESVAPYPARQLVTYTASTSPTSPIAAHPQPVRRMDAPLLRPMYTGDATHQLDGPLPSRVGHPINKASQESGRPCTGLETSRRGQAAGEAVQHPYSQALLNSLSSDVAQAFPPQPTVDVQQPAIRQDIQTAARRGVVTVAHWAVDDAVAAADAQQFQIVTVAQPSSDNFRYEDQNQMTHNGPFVQENPQSFVQGQADPAVQSNSYMSAGWRVGSHTRPPGHGGFRETLLSAGAMTNAPLQWTVGQRPAYSTESRVNFPNFATSPTTAPVSIVSAGHPSNGNPPTTIIAVESVPAWVAPGAQMSRAAITSHHILQGQSIAAGRANNAVAVAWQHGLSMATARQQAKSWPTKIHEANRQGSKGRYK